MQTCYTIRLDALLPHIAIADLVAPGELMPYWTVTRINVPATYRGNGWGSQLLKAILNDADKEQVKLALEVSPSDGLGYGELVAWYRRYGFKSHAYGYMVRKPNPPTHKE